MGNIDMLVSLLTILLLGFIIYTLITSYFWKNWFLRFGTLKKTRRDFYECGFRPQFQKPIQIPIQFLLVCFFFLLYDIELIFLFPLNTSLIYFSLYEILIFIFFLYFLY